MGVMVPVCIYRHEFCLQTTEVLPDFILSQGCHTSSICSLVQHVIIVTLLVVQCLSGLQYIMLACLTLVFLQYWSQRLVFCQLSFEQNFYFSLHIYLFNGEIAITQTHLLTLPFFVCLFLLSLFSYMVLMDHMCCCWCCFVWPSPLDDHWPCDLKMVSN